MKTKAILSLLCSLLVGCAASRPPHTEIPASAVVGTWYRGDGTGPNVTLKLRPDYSYAAVWTGNEGVDGKDAGIWHLHPNSITFTPMRIKGAKMRHFRRVEILPDRRRLVLVPPDSRRCFDLYGSTSGFWCYQRINDGVLIDSSK